MQSGGDKHRAIEHNTLFIMNKEGVYSETAIRGTHSVVGTQASNFVVGYKVFCAIWTPVLLYFYTACAAVGCLHTCFHTHPRSVATL